MSLASRKLIQATAGATTVDTGDDDFANVVLLLDGDGTSGDDNNTFTDSSTNGYTITESGDVVQGSFSPYGDNWSNSFDGNSDALTIADSTDFDFGTGDFTMEAWVYPTDLTDTNNYPSIVSAHEGTDNTSWIFAVSSTNKLVAYGGGSGIQTSTSDVPLNEWSHVMITRSSGTIRFFINGTLDASTYTSTGNYNATSSGIAIGKQPADNGGAGVTRYWQGWISNLRLVKGTALQTSSFTPSTSPLTAVTNTVLLACQSNRFIDNSSSSHTLTPTGTVAVTPFSPFKDSGARDITTDGGSAYLNNDSYKALDAGDGNILPPTDDFTIEGWFYHTGINTANGSNRSGFFNKDKGSNRDVNDGVFRSHFKSSDGTTLDNFDVALFKDGVNSSVAATWTYTFNLFEWYHVAFVRYGSTVELFINGESQGTKTGVTTLEQNTNRGNYIASWRSDKRSELVGYVSDFRIVLSRVYTTDFTPPTSPLTAITNTELLLSFQDAGIYDRSGINNIDTVGNAQIDTAVKKYGTGSIQLDGTGDYLTFDSQLNELSFGTGDFTIEGWFYIQSGDEYPYAFDFRNADSQAAPALYFYNYGNGSIDYYVSGASRILGTSAGNDVWQHIAVCRSGTSTKMFVNGTQSGSTYTDSTNYVAYSGNIGIKYNNARPFKGFIDDFRITKGVARYTSNFTAPTAELPKF